MPGYLLGIDTGGTMTKAALVATDGREVAVSSRRIALLEPRPGHSERDMEAMWRGTAEAVREVLARPGIAPEDVAAVAPTGHGNGLYLVDAAGRPVRNAINSMDRRAQGIVDRWRADGVDARVLPKTAQSLWPGQPNALLAWLREHEPASLAAAAWALMCKDYVRFRLIGEIRAELTDLSGTSLMNVVTGAVDDDVLAAFGIAEMRRLLPPLVRTADVCGTVTSRAAEETGLRAGTPVAGGMFDIDACGLASGLVDGRLMSLVAGTWGNNTYVAREPLVDRDLFMTSCYSIPGCYLMLEGSPTSASNLEWFVSEGFAPAGNGDDPGLSVYDRCSRLVAGVTEADSGLTFLPFLYGSNAGPRATGALVGLQGRHTRAHVLQAVFEGVVFSHATHYRRLLKFRPAPEAMRFTGGAARSAVWLQMFADAFQVPMEVPAGTELGARGAAIAAAVAAGIHPGYREAVGAMTSVARRYEPDPAKKDLYAAKLGRYQETIAALHRTW
jgi:L-xylulokinase